MRWRWRKRIKPQTATAMDEYIGKMQRVLTKNGNEYVGYFQEDDSFMTTFGL